MQRTNITEILNKRFHKIAEILRDEYLKSEEKISAGESIEKKINRLLKISQK